MRVNENQFESAYLIHRRPYRNTSLLLELYTRCHGRVTAVAKGVKRGKRSYYRYCQPFLPLLVSWQGRSDLKTLTSLEMDRTISVRNLTGMGLVSGIYLNELLLRLLPMGDESGHLFDVYQRTVQELSALLSPELIVAEQTEAKRKIDAEVALRRFELSLLAELGFGLDLHFEGGTDNPINADRYYQYQTNIGLVASEFRPEVHVDQLPAKQLFIPGTVLLAMGQDDFSRSETCRYSKLLLRQVLKQLLGPKPLKVRELLPATIRNTDLVDG